MTAILVSILILITIYLVITDRFFIAKKPRNRNYSNQNIPKYKPQKQYQVKAKVEEIPKKQDVNQARSTPKERIVNKKDKGYSRPENELRGLVKDDGAVDRLIISLIDRFPDRSREWCADKALGDWLRDRS